MNFRTRVDLTNRQAKQYEKTNINLSGSSSFGVPYSALTTGPNLNATFVFEENPFVNSTFSGNTGTTIYTWGDSRMVANEGQLTPLTPSNSGVSQDYTDPVWVGYDMFTTVDGYTGWTAYSGVSYDLKPLTMVDLGSGNYSGTVSSDFSVLSATSLDYTGSTVWVDVSGITKTKSLIVEDGAVAGYVLSAIDSSGKLEYIPMGGGTGTTYSFINGLEESGGTVTLGGDLTQHTTIDLVNSYDFIINSEDGSNFKWGGVDIEDWKTGSSQFSYTPKEYIIDYFNTNSPFEYNTGSTVGIQVRDNKTLSSGDYSLSTGSGTTASGIYSNAEGYGSIASNSYSHAEGKLTVSSGKASHAEGTQTTASNSSAHSEGAGSISSGDASHAEGGQTQASGDQSHAEGFGSVASGTSAHAEGQNTVAGGNYSHAEGQLTTTVNDASHAEGYNTTASGWYSHSQNFETIASGDNSHAEGFQTIASGNRSHAEGQLTVASGNSSHAEGRLTTAGGNYSHAGGESSAALAATSFSFGNGNIVESTATNSAILGGANIIALSANTTYVPDLVIDGLTGVTDLQTDSTGRIIDGASDISLKDNITPITNSLEKISSLNPVSFEWKPEMNLRKGKVFGLIAQEVNEIIPEIVRERAKSDGKLTLEYKELIPWLIGAVKELSEGSTTKGVENNDSTIKTDKYGRWIASPALSSKHLILPKFTPTSSDDERGMLGDAVWDDDYIYIKTNNGWGRSNLEKF